MADALSQLLPAATALAGVALTFSSGAWLDSRRWRRDIAAEQRGRSLRVFTDLLQCTTDVARLLRQSAEKMVTDGNVDLHAVGDDVGDLIGQARRHATVARLVGPSSADDLITQLEDALAPVHYDLDQAVRTGNGVPLAEPARALMRLRDELVAHLRDGGHV